MEKYFVNIFYWIIRIVAYYVTYENIETLDTPFAFIGVIIFMYYLPNFMFKIISEFMDEVNRCTKKWKGKRLVFIKILIFKWRY